MSVSRYAANCHVAAYMYSSYLLYITMYFSLFTNTCRQSLPASQIVLISQVVHLMKLVLLMPATNAVSEDIDALH